jgi:hypothetical protein
MVLCPCISRVVEEEENLKREKSSRKQAKAKNADLLDWVLAIDACIR